MVLEGSFDARPPEPLRRNEGSRTDRIAQLIPTFLGDDKEASIRDLQQLIEGDTRTDQSTQDALAAYLFATSSESIPKDKFDSEKQKRQIQATVELLSGNHVHMGTGEGKSSVVFPIVTIVEAVTSHSQNAVLSSVNESLLTELQRHTEKLAGAVKRVLPTSIEITSFTTERHDPQRSLAYLKEGLLTGEYSQQTRNSMREAYWEWAFDASGKQTLPLTNNTGRPQIVLTTERELVFTYMDNPKAFRKNTPTMFMDEAHVPYDRDTPYEKTQDQLFYMPEEIRESTFQWLFDYMVIHHMKDLGFEQILELDRGVWQLREDAMPKMKTVNLTAIQKGDERFTNAVAAVATFLEVKGEEKEKLHDVLFTLWQQGLTARPGGVPLKDRILAIAQEIAKLHNKEGTSYMFDKKNSSVVVRDEYLGWLLTSHRFDPQTQLLLHSLNGSFAVVGLSQRAASTRHFQSFVVAAGDTLRAASGTLLYPDLITGEIRHSPFASFLKDATGKKITLITPPEQKQTPVPKIFPSEEDAMHALVQHVGNRPNNPTLVVTWHEREADTLAAKMQDAGYRVALVNAITSEIDEKLLYQKLADGQLDAVVTSGRAGIGVDIKTTDGSFPDLHISLFNLPQTQLQIIQALGRRRKQQQETSFSWYIARPALEQGLSHFEDRAGIIERFLGARDVQHLEATLADSKSPRRRLGAVTDVLRKLEQAKGIDDELVVAYDNLMEITQHYAQRLETQTIEAQMPKLPPDYREWFTTEFGIPEDLYWYPLTELPFLHGAANIKDLVENKLAHRLGLGGHMVPKQHETPLVDEWMSQWHEERKGPMEEFASIVWELAAEPGFQKTFQPYPDNPDGFGTISVKDSAGNRKKVLARKKENGEVVFIAGRMKTPLGLVDVYKIV